MRDLTDMINELMQMPMADLIASLSDEVRQRMIDMAAADQRHADFLGPEMLAILASYDAASIEATAAMKRMRARSLR